MSLKTQLEGLVGISLDATGTPTTAQASQYMIDGVKEVITRILRVAPLESNKFAASEEESFDTNGISLSGRMLSVVRDDGSDVYRPCTEVSPQFRYEATQKDSLKYRSKYNPGFYQLDGKVYTIPSAAAEEGMVVTQISYDSSIDLSTADEDIDLFPTEYKYLVVLYAGLRTIHYTLASISLPSDLSTLNIAVAPPSPPGNVPDAPNIVSEVLGVTGDIDIPNIYDVTVEGVSATDLGTAPTYDPPPIAESGGNNITGILNNSGSDSMYGMQQWYDNYFNYFNVLGKMIEENEDVELAQVQTSKIKTYLEAYQSAMQNNLNRFNEENAEYQAEVKNKITALQGDIQKAQKDADLTFAKASKNAEIQLQEAVKNKDVDMQIAIQDETFRIQALVENYKQQMTEYSLRLNKYQQEVAQYQMEVQTEVGESTQNVQRITTDVQKTGVRYNWLVEQYSRIKGEYDAAFGIMAPRQNNRNQESAPARERRRRGR